MQISNKKFTNIGLILLSILVFFIPTSGLNTFEETPPSLPIFETVATKKGNVSHVESFPVEISIESIGVEAAVQAVGVLDGAMAVPDSKDYVGWYKFGTHPGDIGVAVLAGHVNWKHGEDAVFTHLKDIQVGDIVSIFDNFGREDKFVVQKIEQYPLDTDTSEIFFSTDGTSKLNLITCYGTWNPERKTHDSRLVVFTEKI